MSTILKYRGALTSFRRLRGLPWKRKLQYMSKVVAGEVLSLLLPGARALRLVEIGLTDRCQCRCSHCFAARKAPEDELSRREVETLLDDLSATGAEEICLSGGEPLLHPDVVPLVASAARRNFVVRIITNGILLNERTVLELRDAGLSWCSVSLDAATAAEHDAFRGHTGCFNKASAGLKCLVRHHIPCSIIAVARRDLIDSGGLEDIVRLGNDLGVPVVRINFPVPMGRFKEHHHQVLTREERDKVRQLLRHGNTIMESPNEGTSCKAAITKINILPNGDVTPCVFAPLPYGNIRSERFAEIWERMGDFSRSFKKNGQCPVCDREMSDRMFDAADIWREHRNCRGPTAS